MLKIINITILSVFLFVILSMVQGCAQFDSVPEMYVDAEAYTHESVPLAFDATENLVSVDAELIEFSYNDFDKSKTLLLKSLETQFEFTAIIYSDIKVPYLNEGSIYRFHGITEETTNEIILRVTTLEDVHPN